MSAEHSFTKEDVDFYFKELAKEYKKAGGKAFPAEIIIVGGASVLVNYGFRESTTDIDAVILAASMIQDSIKTIRDRYELRDDWINTDFKMTASYSEKLRYYATYYKEFSRVIKVYTIRAEYLVAMKLVSGRQYKKDLSDIVGIIQSQQQLGHPLSFDDIDNAVKNIYGSWDKVSDYSKLLLEKALASDDLPGLFAEQMQEEKITKETIQEIEEKYPDLISKDNINDIISIARRKAQGLNE